MKPMHSGHLRGSGTGGVGPTGVLASAAAASINGPMVSGCGCQDGGRLAASPVAHMTVSCVGASLAAAALDASSGSGGGSPLSIYWSVSREAVGINVSAVAGSQTRRAAAQAGVMAASCLSSHASRLNFAVLR